MLFGREHLECVWRVEGFEDLAGTCQSDMAGAGWGSRFVGVADAKET